MPRPPLATVASLDSAPRVLAVRRDVLQEKLAADPRFAAHFYRAVAIFLADRPRAATTQVGYGQPEQDAANDLGDELLKTSCWARGGSTIC